MSDRINLLRSFLFVPGNRPERFDKARTSGADIYCIDLEDAVPGAEKAAARSAALDHIARRGAEKNTGPACFFRINTLTSPAGLEDLLALAVAAREDLLPDCIVLPKATSEFEIAQITHVLNHHPSLKIMPMIETPRGVEALPSMLAQSSCVEAVAFGFADYAAVTGSDMGWDALLMARSAIISAASARGVPCLDGPWFDIGDVDGLRQEAGRVSRLGFKGKLAIHPTQVSAINESFQPSSKELAWAAEVIAAFERSGGGVVSVNGMMIDQPVVDQARRILAAAPG
jgi:(S)-citramalyl-CoA lyase